MDFNLSKQQELIRQLMHDFAENEVKPLAAEIDDTEQFPVETVRKMAKYGMLGINIPAQYGGAGGDTLRFAQQLQSFSAHTRRLPVILSLHTAPKSRSRSISFPLQRVKSSAHSVLPSPAQVPMHRVSRPRLYLTAMNMY